MAKRTEEQIISQQSVKVWLGEEQYEIKPLTMRKAQAWREKLAPLMEKINARSNATNDTQSLQSAIMESPAETAEAVFSYLDLPKDEREKILDSATEEQMLIAFNHVMGLTFSPFLTQASIVKAVLHPESLLAASVQPSRLQ